jgi:hypothetical protein
MMFGKLINSWASKVQRKEAEAFLSILRTMDADELAHVLAITLEWAETLHDEKEWDMFYPAVVVFTDQMSVVQLSQLANKLRREGKPQLAAGVMVWVHSLRAFANPEIRPFAREIWMHLQRGAFYVDQVSVNVTELLGRECRTHRAGEIPDGLTPNAF